MQIVREARELAAALAAARRLAQSAFGDSALLLERYLAAPRHLEVQVFADAPRQLRAPRRPRLFHAASPPEAHRGSAGTGGARRGARAAAGRGLVVAREDRLRERRHGRVPVRRARVLFHGNEHAPAGRAHRDRGGHRTRPRRMAAAGRCRRAAAAVAGGHTAQRARHRGAGVRGRPRARLSAERRSPAAARMATAPSTCASMRASAAATRCRTVTTRCSAR